MEVDAAAAVVVPDRSQVRALQSQRQGGRGEAGGGRGPAARIGTGHGRHPSVKEAKKAEMEAWLATEIEVCARAIFSFPSAVGSLSLVLLVVMGFSAASKHAVFVAMCRSPPHVSPALLIVVPALLFRSIRHGGCGVGWIRRTRRCSARGGP